ncbi:MAG: hypothetical protein IPL36_05400 [Nigerium sp.]|nr:hypothetical protein [Nigerium sp.]
MAAESADTGNYFIAVEFTVRAAGEDPMVGVWQSNTLEDGGPIASVDAFAKTYTQWPDSGNQGAEAQRVAEGCLR